MHLPRTILLLALSGGVALSAFGQTAPASATPAASGQTTYPATSADGSTQRTARPRATHRTRHRYVATPTSAQPSPSATQTVGPDAAQRTRDAQILAAQKAQSAEIARQNAMTIGNVERERAAQQAEPRIQDAPGPGTQPLAGDPAVPPKVNNDPQAIQDAPGPAQTLPQAPPAQPQS